jgi:hypothetical protein
VVSRRKRPNRYTPFPAVRSSEDRRPPLVVFAIEDWDNGEARVCRGSSGAHLRLLVDDLVTMFGCGASEKIGDSVGEVSVVAAVS